MQPPGGATHRFAVITLCAALAGSSVAAAQGTEQPTPSADERPGEAPAGGEPNDDPETYPPAEPEPDRQTHREPWLPLGVTGGWLGSRDGHAFVIGGELSLIWVELTRNRGMFATPKDASAAFGVVVDAVWVSNPSHFRAMLGAEVMACFGGAYAAGVEAGATFHSRGDPVGFRVRGFFTLLWPTLYAGVDYHGRVAGEVGLLLKFPVPL
jgi:hypothetical protein